MRASKSPALGRFESDMQRLLTTLMQRDIEDPMLLQVCLTRLDLTDPRGHAIAYVHSIMDIDAKEAVRRLNKLAPHFLHDLRKAMPKKRMPELLFRWDEALDKTHRVLDTIEGVRS